MSFAVKILRTQFFLSENNFKMRHLLLSLKALLLVFCLSVNSIAAEQNSLLNFAINDRLPAMNLPLVDTNQNSMSTDNGNPTVIMFFGLSPAFRSKRSLNLVEILNNIKPGFTDRVNFAAVYSENKVIDTVQQFIADGLFTFPVFNDSDKSIYNRYGLFMLPLAIIINQQGKLHAVIPYTHMIDEIITNNLKLLLGDFTKEEFLETLKPNENIVRSKEEKEYIRRVNYGRVMMARKIYPAAMREYNTASKILPKRIEAITGLGFAQLATKKLQKAESSFKKALTINSDNDEAIAGLGLTLFKMKKYDQSLSVLENASISADQKIDVIISLAEIYEMKGNMSKSIRLNKLAVKKLMGQFYN